MKWVLVYVILGVSPVPGQTGSIATHSVEFTTEEACNAAKAEVVTMGEAGRATATAWCFPK